MMKAQRRNANAVTRAACLCASLTLLVSCSGSNGSIDPGGGQSPDPATVDFPIFYVKRPVPMNPSADQDDLRRLRTFRVGADLFMRDRASPSAPERNLTEAL